MRVRHASGLAVLLCVSGAALACAQIIGADEVTYEPTSSGGTGGGDASVEGAAGGSAGSGGTAGSSGAGGTSGASGSGGSSQGGASGQGGSSDAGSCDGGLAYCAGSCVDTKSSAQHCGACGKNCGVAVCQDGVCQAEKLSGTLNHVPLFLDVDSSGIYWASESACGSMEPSGLGGKVIKDLTPGKVKAMVAGPVALFMIVDYPADGGTDHRIVKVTKSDGQVENLLMKLVEPKALAISNSWLYWSSTNYVEGLNRIGLNGETPSKYGQYMSLIGPTAWGDNVCFATGGSTIDCIHPGTDASIAAVKSLMNVIHISGGLGTDHVFWIAKHPPSGPHYVGGALWDGTAAQDVLIDGVGDFPGYLTAEGEWVYFVVAKSQIRGYRWKDVAGGHQLWYSGGTTSALLAKGGSLYWANSGDSYIYRVVR